MPGGDGAEQGSRWASAAAVSMTATVCGTLPPVPGTRPRLELPTSAMRPLSASASPTGSEPVRTTARSAPDGSCARAAAEKASSALDCRAVTQTVLPSGDTATRTGWHPAAA